MGTAKKRQRRNEKRVFSDYLIAFEGRRIPLKESDSAMDMLREFSEPLARFLDDERTLYSISIFAWNVSLMPPEKRDELIEEFIMPLVKERGETRGPLINMIKAMIDRREKLYAREDVAFLPVGDARGPEPGGIAQS
jgi:hypothetical protein